MIKRLFTLFLTLSLLVGCAPGRSAGDGSLRVLCTTYPVYLFTTAVVGETEGVEVSLLVNAQTACLHDYTLTVRDMKAVEGADVIVMNGAGLEEFMSAALEHSDAPVIDCSAAVDLLPAPAHHDHDSHDHGEEWDPHYWMSPGSGARAVSAIAEALSALDPDNAQRYEANCADALAALTAIDPFHRDSLLPPRPLITFHDGFQYFADAYGLELLRAIEEDEGATASASELKELIALVEERHIPAIFVEKNGSRASADVIARETGCRVLELDMLMSGEGRGIQPYIDAVKADLTTVMEAFG